MAKARECDVGTRTDPATRSRTGAFRLLFTARPAFRILLLPLRSQILFAYALLYAILF